MKCKDSSLFYTGDGWNHGKRIIVGTGDTWRLRTDCQIGGLSFYVEIGMMQLDSETLRKLQAVELEMLLEVDRICKKHNITYAIAGGTLLGAVRHKGFIPWDDDADVGMLRKEYERFRQVCVEELDTARFYFQDDRNTKGYRWGYGKLRRRETLFLREHQEHMPYEQGAFIDIFPIDGVPENPVLARLNQFHCFCVRKIFWSPVGAIAERKRWKALLYRGLSHLPDKAVYSHYQKMIEKSNRKSGKYVRVLMFPMPDGIHDALRECFEETIPLQFEGYELQAPKNYEFYLRLHYGNYHELPPEEKRKVHPVTAIQLVDVKLP